MKVLGTLIAGRRLGDPLFSRWFRDSPGLKAPGHDSFNDKPGRWVDVVVVAPAFHDLNAHASQA